MIKKERSVTRGLRVVDSHEPSSGPLCSSRQTWRGVTDAEMCSEILLFNRLVGLLREKRKPINLQNMDPHINLSSTKSLAFHNQTTHYLLIFCHNCPFV